jgi:hypothetical protein
MSTEPVLIAALPGKSDNDRLALFLNPGSASGTLALCQQSWADGIGWFTQSKVDVDASQVGSLRQALGQGGTSRLLGQVSSRPTSHPTLRVVG